MWRIRSERLELYLCSGLLGWRWSGEVTEHWQAVDSLEEGLSLGRSEAQSRPTARLRIWLSSSLARPISLMSMAESGARNSGELSALARAQASAQAGEATIWLGRPTRGSDWLAVAVDAADWSRIGAALGDGTARLDSIRPWWDQALSHILPGTAKQATVADGAITGFSIAEPGGMILGAMQQDRLIEIGFEVAAAYDPDWRLTLRRHALSVGTQGAAMSFSLHTASTTRCEENDGTAEVAVGSLARTSR